MSGSFGIMLFMVRLLNVACKRSSLPNKGVYVQRLRRRQRARTSCVM